MVHNYLVKQCLQQFETFCKSLSCTTALMSYQFTFTPGVTDVSPQTCQMPYEVEMHLPHVPRRGIQ